MTVKYLYEEWDYENLQRKYPFRKTADLKLAGPTGQIDLPTDFLLDAIICAPGYLSDFVLHSISVSGDTVLVRVSSALEKLTATVKITSDFAPLIGEESGAVYGCLVYGTAALNFRHHRPGEYFASLTNKFVPKIFKSVPQALTSLSVGGKKLFGNILITAGRGVSLDSNNNLDLTGNKYLHRDKLYNLMRPGEEILVPALTINGENNNGVYNFEIWNTGDNTTQRLKVRSVKPDTLLIEDVKDLSL